MVVPCGHQNDEKKGALQFLITFVAIADPFIKWYCSEPIISSKVELRVAPIAELDDALYCSESKANILSYT